MARWKAIPSWEAFYEASDDGRIRSLRRGRDLSQYLINRYPAVHLTDMSTKRRVNALVHRLVAETFLPNPEGKQEVNHKNGDRLDNTVGNLEWVTPDENLAHAIETGLYKAKLSFQAAQEIRMLKREGHTLDALAAKFDVSLSTVFEVVRGNRWARDYGR